MHGADALGQVEALDVFCHITPGPRPYALLDQSVVRKGGHYEHGDTRMGGAQPPARFGATDTGQASIEQDHVGTEVVHQFTEPLGRSRLGYHVEVRFPLEDRLEALPDDLMVIDYHDLDQRTALGEDALKTRLGLLGVSGGARLACLPF
jgi:hypothetical protein